MLGTFSILLLIVTVHQCEDVSEYTDINDLFKSFSDSASYPEGIANVSFDITQIDINKAKTNMHRVLEDKIKEEDKIIKPSRRQDFYDIVNVINPLGWYTERTFREAMFHLQKKKAIDSILQLIYMARHQIRQVESDDNYDLKDTSFRIGYVYNKMKTILAQMIDILNYMHTHNYKLDNIRTHLVLHHKCVKLHVDYQYYYWVMIQLDSKHKESQGYTKTLPKEYQHIGGISIEKGNMYMIDDRMSIPEGPISNETLLASRYHNYSKWMENQNPNEYMLPE